MNGLLLILSPILLPYFFLFFELFFVQSGSLEQPPSLDLPLDHLEGLHDQSSLSLDADNLLNFHVVFCEGKTLFFEQSKIHQQIETPVGLSHEFEVASGSVNLCLEYDEYDHETRDGD